MLNSHYLTKTNHYLVFDSDTNKTLIKLLN